MQLNFHGQRDSTEIPFKAGYTERQENSACKKYVTVEGLRSDSDRKIKDFGKKLIMINAKTKQIYGILELQMVSHNY